VTPLLEVKDLRVTYRTAGGPLPAVRGVDLTVGKGESVGVAGESGCGKSSLATTVLRLQPRNAKVEGEVLMEGADVQTMPWGTLRAVRWAEASIIFQGALHSLNPVQKIGRQIAEPILLHQSNMTRAGADRRVAELLEQVGLPAARANQYPHQMSGGQKQRVMIALALACQPQLIIADEPTTALDVMVQAQVLRVLTGLVRELDLGLLLISHDLSVLSTTCDRVVVMYAGRIVEEAPAHQIFDHPHHPYSGALAAAFPRIGDRSARYAPSGLAGDPPYPIDLPSGCTFHVRCPWATEDCASTDPALRSTGPDRAVACIHADGTNAKLDTPKALAGERGDGGADVEVDGTASDLPLGGRA
jgi:peptide/nickel transport system ATP-binding protein